MLSCKNTTTMKGNRLSCKRYHVIMILLGIVNCAAYAQVSSESVIRTHYKDGYVSEVPIYMVDSITFGYTNSGNDIRPTFTDSITSNEVLQRAYLMASVEWLPLKRVPRQSGQYFEADKMVQGIPYSSVKEINTYLFQDVSYHTFMTAVHNPKSVLYTEDISKPPYHGTNCGTYYGSVCSSSVCWALGMDVPYSTSQIIKLPDMKELEYQFIDSLKICDVIWKSGHVQMIYDMEFKDNTLYSVTTFEQSGLSAHIKKYSKAEFQFLWNNEGYVGYRYNKLIHSKLPSIIYGWDSITYNDDLCPSKGDKALYRTTDTVTINILNPSYEKIVLTRGASIIASNDIHGDIHKYYDLQPGIYSIFLEKAGKKTARVSFEVVKTDVNFDFCEDGENINMYFNSSAMPEFAAKCSIDGVSTWYPISDLDRWRGYITIPRNNGLELYCKVIFRGGYGRIANVPIKVE